MGNLTALAVRNAAKPGRYQDGDGLMLLVKPTGAKSWLLRTQVDGKRRDFGLGSGKDVTLAEAREKAMEIRKMYRSGIDPVAKKKSEKAAQRAVPTFREAANSVHQEHKAGWKNGKHQAQWISSLEAYAFPFVGDVTVDVIDGPMIRDLLIPIWLEKPETARRVRQRVGTVLDWAHSKGYRANEAPMRAVSKGLPRQPKMDRHFAALPYAQIPALMVKLGQSDSSGRLALQFLILTAARSGEVRGATWEEINIEDATWTVPASKMKAGREHIVPLSQPALALLEKAKAMQTGRIGEPIFPGMHGQCMSDMTIAKAMKTAGISGATVHGFRSGFRDWAAEMTGTPGDVVEAALAHTISNRIEAAYRRTNYLEKRRQLMKAWASFLFQTSADVVKLAIKS